jgi:hypothetical protein
VQAVQKCGGRHATSVEDTVVTIVFQPWKQLVECVTICKEKIKQNENFIFCFLEKMLCCFFNKKTHKNKPCIAIFVKFLWRKVNILCPVITKTVMK